MPNSTPNGNTIRTLLTLATLATLLGTPMIYIAVSLNTIKADIKTLKINSCYSWTSVHQNDFVSRLAARNPALSVPDTRETLDAVNWPPQN